MNKLYYDLSKSYKGTFWLVKNDFLYDLKYLIETYSVPAIDSVKNDQLIIVYV